MNSSRSDLRCSLVVESPLMLDGSRKSEHLFNSAAVSLETRNFGIGRPPLPMVTQRPGQRNHPEMPAHSPESAAVARGLRTRQGRRISLGCDEFFSLSLKFSKPVLPAGRKSSLTESMSECIYRRISRFKHYVSKR